MAGRKKQIRIETVVSNVKMNSTAIKGMADVIDKLRLSINRVANQNPKMITGFNQMTQNMNKFKTATAGSTIKLGAMLYTVNQIGDKLGTVSSKLVNFGITGAKSLFEVASSFEYIQAGLDFAFGSRSQMVMAKALNAAQETNISTREVLDVTRSLGVLKIDPFSEMRLNSGKTQVALKSLADLAALVPQQGMQGALFAIRNALSGQWRSLQMRFDIPLNIIEDMRKGITEAMNTQQRFDIITQGITRHFGGLMQSVENTAKFSIDNIKDVFTNIIYDIGKQINPILTPIFKSFEAYLKAFRKDEKKIKIFADTIGTFASALGTTLKFLTSLVTFIGGHPFLIKMTIGLGAFVTIAVTASAILAKMASAFILVKLGMDSFGISSLSLRTKVSGATGAIGGFKSAVNSIPWNAIGAGVTIAIAAFTALYNAIRIARGEAAKLSDIQNTGMSLDQYASAASDFRSLASKINKGETPDAAMLGETLTKAANLGTLKVSEGELAQFGLVTRESNGIKRIVPSFGTEASKVLTRTGLKDLGVGPAAEEKRIKIWDKIVQSFQAGESASRWRLSTPENMMSQQAEYKKLSSEYEVSNKAYQAATGGFIGRIRSQYPQLKNVPDSILNKAVNKAMIQSTPEKATASLINSLGLSTTGTMPTGRISGKTMSYIPPVSTAAEFQGFQSTLRTAFEQYAPKGTAFGETSMSSSWRNSVVNALKTYTEGLSPTEMRDLMLKTAGGQQWGGEIERSKDPTATTIEKALVKGSDKALYDLIQYFKGADEKSEDLLEGIEKNTKKVEELLPPIFREIFDKFTRRGLLASQGRAAFLGAR